MTPDDPRHGAPRGYAAHRREKETACDPCLRAAALYDNQLRLEKMAGRGSRRIPATGTARRIQALVAIGYTYVDLAEEFGWSHDMPMRLATRKSHVLRSTAERVAEVYDRFHMTPQTGTRRANYARSVARKHGWSPPLAWDDIDDPNEPPDLGSIHDDEYDEAVVLRILSGEWRLPATKADRAEVVRRCTISLSDLAELTGWKPERYRTNEVAA